MINDSVQHRSPWLRSGFESAGENARVSIHSKRFLGRPRGAMSTLFALEGVNFFDAFTFEAHVGILESGLSTTISCKKKKIGRRFFLEGWGR